VTALAIMASCYLLFGRANVIAPDIKPPMRLRRWTAAFFASFALNHLWYMPILFNISSEDVMMIDLTGGLLDCLTVIPLVIVVLFAMLQDRQRPLWIVAAMMAPLVVGMVWSIAYRSYALQPIGYAYFLIMCIGLSIYMVRAVRQYGKWLRNNYADLEHKEVWQSFVVLAIIMLVFVIYASASEGVIYQYAMQMIIIVLICYLLWRIETLSDLSISQQQSQLVEEPATTESEDVDNYELPQTIHDKIGPLLKQYCEEPQLYLQYDLTLSQLANLIGTNRLYLSQHFSSQGMTYNAYINGLRIQHFIRLYHEAAATHQPVRALQLAYQSGFRNYNTFNAAFKKIMEMTATEWMQHVKS
jgi:AraC-like DNA-binding protein